jgi:CBS domain-containing protein
MVTNLVTLSPETEVFEAIETLLRNQISGAPVVDADGRYHGVFSERSSISLLLASAYEGTPLCQIEAFIDRDVPTIEPETDLFAIAQKFLTATTRRLPVLEGGRLVGQISRRDVLKAANKLLEMRPTEGSNVLYLSGLRDSSDSAILVRGRV